MVKNKINSGVKKPKVFVAMSGGVDSSVASAMLQKATPNNFSKLFGRPTPKGFRGYEVVGVHIKMWSPRQSLRVGTGQADPFFSVCKQQYQDRIDAMKVAAVLNIPFETWDLTREYKKAVVDYMVREFKTGRTPNPDVMCNKHIKFGVFLRKALEKGADYVATGHYVKLVASRKVAGRKEKNLKFSDLQATSYKLQAARDSNKDQSYFLWTLTQNQLRHCLFPIGEYTKPEIRKLAKKLKLPNAEKKDSQGICFIGEINLREFLQKYIKSKPGKIVTTGGKTVGEHTGLQFYTIGQRHEINIGGGIPFYVVKKDFKKNRLIVAEGPYDEKLFSSKLVAANINWISGNPPKFPLQCLTRIRYRQPPQKCVITGNLKLITCNFIVPQRAVTEGQSVVFYKGQEMLGGGIIK